MDYLTLKNTDIVVSRLCMGGCPMGGYGWGDVQEKELLAAVDAALDAGVTFFDTADTYGLGQSEKTLARALGRRRSEVVIASKFGVRVGDGGTVYDNDPSYIQTALEGSLRRLNTDYIDLYQVHYWDRKTPICEVVSKLEELKGEGKIRAYGLSNIGETDLDELRPYRGLFASFQNEYSLACRVHEADITFAASALEATPMTWGSLGQGILTGKYNKDSVFSENDRRSRDVYVNFHGERLAKNLKTVAVLAEIASVHGVSTAAVAIRFILDYLEGSVALVGAKRPSQVKLNVEAMGWHLSEQELSLLERVSQ